MNEEVKGDPRELRAREGELRRLTFMYCDVVGSTELAGRQEPETYRELMRGYRAVCRDVIEARYDGHIMVLTGDGTLATFGFPAAHENDAERAVRAGLELVEAVRRIEHANSGEPLDVRVAIHHGPVYLDLDEDDIYGLAANVGSRLQALADPGTVFISEEVRRLVDDHFDFEQREPQVVKGVAEPITPFRVIGERAASAEQSWATPLVEREAELERLRATWVQVAGGDANRATGVLVRGDAGVGKSRLASALTGEVSADNVVELLGSPFHVNAGLHPVRALLERRCGIKNDTDPARRLERLAQEIEMVGRDPSATLPLLAPILGIDPSAGYVQAAAEGRKLEQQVSHAALDYVIACLDGKPGVIVAENLHWFDDATRALAENLVRTGPGSVLVLGTSREDERGPWEKIELEPLSLDGRLALIDALKEGLPEQERLALATRSDGIPLYIEELVRAGPVTDDTRPYSDAPVPGSVPAALYEPLVAKLYATPSALPVAATAAAAGQEVVRSLLAETMSIPDEELDSTLEALVDARVLEPIRNGEVRYQFRHELLREVAYELQPPSWRRKVHDRLCDCLSRDDPSDWTVLALHCERAERHREAATAHQKAADWARRRGAMDEARTHLTRAIDLVGQLDPGSIRDHLEVELRLRRGFLAMTADGVASPDAAADFDRCVELAAADPRSDDMFSTSISVWAYDLCRAELGRARRMSEAMRAAMGAERAYFRPQNLAGLGMLDWFEGSFTDAVAKLSEASNDLSAMGREDEVAAMWFVPNHPVTSIYVHLGLAQFMNGDSNGADESIARARDLAATLDFPQGPWSIAYALWLGSWVWIESDRLGLAGEALAELRASSTRHGFDSWELVAATQTTALGAVTAMRTPDAEPAVLSGHAEALGTQIDVWQLLGLKVFLPFYMTTAGALLAAAGDAEGARRRYEESLQLAAETGMCFYDAETSRRMAHLSSDREELVAKLGAAMDLARSQGARPFERQIALDLDELGLATPR